MSIGIKDIIRSGHVTRWHMVRTTRSQTLAEHLYLVTMIALDIYDGVYEGKSNPSDKMELLEWSLRHDTPELLTGDLPTPIKRRLEAYFKEGQNPLDELEDATCPKFKAAKEAVEGKAVERIVKLADLADAIAFLQEEGVNEHSKVIRNQTIARYKDYCYQSRQMYPELNWDAALKTLDEIIFGSDSQIDFEWND